MWHKIENGLPTKEGKYLCCYKSIGGRKEIDVQGFTLDAFSKSHYDFAEYKDQKKAIFYEYDSEYGYSDWTEYITHWMEMPELPND